MFISRNIDKRVRKKPTKGLSLEPNIIWERVMDHR